MRVVFSSKYNAAVLDHPWKPEKYGKAVTQLLDEGILSTDDVVEVDTADYEDALLVHSWDYLQKIEDLAFSEDEERMIEVPVTPEIANLSWAFVEGTIVAGRLAMDDGICVHIGGGMHHAYPEYGSGFCLLNDIAIGIRVIQRQKLIKKALVIDCDVHQGDGTAKIFENDPSVFTFSMHQGDLFPYPKRKSGLDIEVPNGTGDVEYHRLLDRGLESIQAPCDECDLIHYQAGVDPFVGDELAGLCVSEAGLSRRDEMVIEFAHNAGKPLVVTMGGGYSDMASVLHANTVKVAAGFMQSH
jgi:acetoin utilization deacetylase AcuC-like enzyme